MADPFEVRMRFTYQLQHLNASVTSAQKAAHYALKYKDMDEDLHSCILEQLERNSMNNRANIMYFIEHLCDMAQRENHLDFIRMMQRDVIRVVDAVAPSDGSGAANIKVVRKVLQALAQKNVLEPKSVAELEELLKERDINPPNATMSPVASASGTREGQATATSPSKAHGPAVVTTSAVSVGRLDKRQIEQRIEEDRERHKRLKESIWGIDGDGDAEFRRLWDEVSDVGEDDYLNAEEEAAERQRAVELDAAERAH